MGYSNNQGLISGQPPLLVFTLCLTAFGLTMVILAYVVGEQDVPNPDIQMDWNKFLKKVSSFKLCPVLNDTRTLNGGPLSRISHKALYNTETVLNSSHVVDESKSMSAVLSDVVHYASEEQFDRLEYVEVSARVQFKLIGKVHPSSFFQVSGKIKGSLLGFTGKYSSLVFNVSLSFISPVNNSCFEESCTSVWDVCLIMNIPSDLLYETKSPDRCDIKATSSPDILPAFFLDGKKSDSGDPSVASCLALDYKPNSKLTVMLSLHDRSIVNLHLMHTSYFMFVMVMTLVCYSLIRGRYRHPKSAHSHEKVPLDA